MAKYFKKQIVDAIQFKGDIQEVIDFTGKNFRKHEIYSSLVDDSGKTTIDYGDFIVKVINEIFEVHKPNQFENIYQPLKK